MISNEQFQNPDPGCKWTLNLEVPLNIARQPTPLSKFVIQSCGLAMHFVPSQNHLNERRHVLALPTGTNA